MLYSTLLFSLFFTQQHHLSLLPPILIRFPSLSSMIEEKRSTIIENLLWQAAECLSVCLTDWLTSWLDWWGPPLALLWQERTICRERCTHKHKKEKNKAKGEERLEWAWANSATRREKIRIFCADSATGHSTKTTIILHCVLCEDSEEEGESWSAARVVVGCFLVLFLVLFTLLSSLLHPFAHSPHLDTDNKNHTTALSSAAVHCSISSTVSMQTIISYCKVQVHFLNLSSMNDILHVLYFKPIFIAELFTYYYCLLFISHRVTMWVMHIFV